MCKFSHRRTCLYVTCHLISHVLSRPTCFHTKLSSTRRGHARVHTLKDWCLHTCWLTKTCLCVTFNFFTEQPTFVVETTYHHTTLTYEPFPVSNFWHMKQCLWTLVLLIRRRVFTVKRRASLYTTFWLTWWCACANFAHAHVFWLVPTPLSRRTCVQTRRSRQTIFEKRCLVCQKLCRNILFGQSDGKVRDTDMSLIWQKRDIDTSS